MRSTSFFEPEFGAPVGAASIDEFAGDSLVSQAKLINTIKMRREFSSVMALSS